MTNEEAHVIAIAFVLLWLASGVLRLMRHPRAAVVLNALLVMPTLIGSLLPILQVLIDKDGYIRQYGRAALPQLSPTLLWVTSCLMALGLSLLSLRRSGWFFLGGWLAIGVQVPAIIYLAFFLRIF